MAFNLLLVFLPVAGILYLGSYEQKLLGLQRRALQEESRRLDEHVRFIESFAADVVSHEFKNPLASIRTATEMLAEVDEQEQRRRFLRMVELEIARMESLLAGVREITMIDAQLTTELRTRVDVRGLLERIVDGFRMRGNVSIEFEFAGRSVRSERVRRSSHPGVHQRAGKRDQLLPCRRRRHDHANARCSLSHHDNR